MARASKKAESEPIVFPKGTPGWKRIKCGLCGAEPNNNCLDLTAATSGGIATSATPDGRGQKRAPTISRTLKEPHARRVADAKEQNL